MDKLEHYLDQVCRSIGGPKSLRQHVRQELREHLLDAAAEHRAAGLSEQKALDRAIEDFGGPEEVRSGLEEAHGYRLLPVVIDKAMQWKERTMRAKWLWMTWAHLALAGLIALELTWLAFAAFFLVPKFQKLMLDGIIDPEVFKQTGITWMPSFLEGLRRAWDLYMTWLLLLTIALGGLFEWRVRSENKSVIRLSAWGTVAVGLMIAAVLTGGSLVIPYQLAAPATGRIARPFAIQQLASIDTSIGALEQALSKKNWESMQEHADHASQSLTKLVAAAPAVRSLTPESGPTQLPELRAKLSHANNFLAEAQQAAREKDVGRVEASLRKFRGLYEPVVKAAPKP
ncbi:MAG TPA: permease prefix domain 1-containing protein [Gemmataceae bacterium]|jgi:hypothetical protein